MQVDENRWLLFDVTMGAYYVAEVCELAETFSLASVYIMTTGCQYLKTQLERIKKSLQKTFKDFGLEIAAESNLRIVNYLDVTLNINDGSFRPCDKPDDIFSTLTKNLTTLLILLSTCQHLLKNGFQTILLMKKYFKNQLFIMKIH